MSETGYALQIGTGKTLHRNISEDGSFSAACGAEYRNGRRAHVRKIKGEATCARCERCTSNGTRV